MMFRKTLETGLKAKFPDIGGKLEKRIDKAAELGGLTPDVWPHGRIGYGLMAMTLHMRRSRLKKKMRAGLCAFTQMVLLYLFTLPRMLKKARA